MFLFLLLWSKIVQEDVSIMESRSRMIETCGAKDFGYKKGILFALYACHYPVPDDDLT